MRNIFVKELVNEAKKNPNIILITGDLGYRSFETFSSQFPDRFINCGVAENNMVGIGAGLALTGKKVFLYSIIPFLVFRSLEQIRNNICHNNLDVKIIGGGGGFSYGEQGISHNPTEDFAIIKSLPKIKIFSPGTINETKKSIKLLIKDKGPCYVRLGKVPEFDYTIDKDYKIGTGLEIKKGSKVLILSTGNIISEVIRASQELEKKNISTQLVSFPCIKPLDNNFVKKLLKNFQYILTIEEHETSGGFGSSVEEILINIPKKSINFKKIGLNNEIHNEIGTQDYLRKIKKINYKGIVNSVLKLLK